MPHGIMIVCAVDDIMIEAVFVISRCSQMSTEVSPLIIYEKENLKERVEQIQRLEKIGLEAFCEEWILDPKLACYFPTGEFKCIIDDPDRSKSYFWFMMALLEAFGLEMVDYVRGIFVVKDNFFLRFPGKTATVKIFSFILENLGDMGFIPHVLEILKNLQVEYRHEKFNPCWKLEMPKYVVPARDRIRRRYCILQINPEDWSRKVVWNHSNRFTTAVLPPEFQQPDKRQITECSFVIQNKRFRMTLCHHGLLVKPSTDGTTGGCLFDDPEVSCGYKIRF